MDKNIKRISIGLIAGVIIFSSVAPNTLMAVQASEIETSRTVEVDDETLVDNAVNEIVAEVQSGQNVQSGYNPNARIGGGLIAKLILKYGQAYVMKTLPKIIYPKISGFVGRWISQAKFVQIWGKAVNWGTGKALETALAKAFKDAGIGDGPSKLAAKVIVNAMTILL